MISASHVSVLLADGSISTVRVPTLFAHTVEAYELALREREQETGELLRAKRLAPPLLRLPHPRVSALEVADREPERVAGDRPPLLVDYAGAAALLSTTVDALKSRVSRGDNKLLAALVSNGRSVRFSVAKLTEKFSPRPAKRRR
jgi:hypothetical protein